MTTLREYVNYYRLHRTSLPRSSIALTKNQLPKTFVEVCIYEVKPEKAEEFEHLIERVAKHHRDFPGVIDVRYVKRTHRQGDFEDIKKG